ncbi:LAME_0E01772g1_1 [Lachancea meyersii CBS 8951]|uniref:Ceramide very long chain fatty acid hydroxylase n=1 Tax=Lachancea meyersii CBS 8951 TaxID=1266667 RepID=A0A1G4JFD3_9SACH|nr:LAME_0E01772g1_1 [Lachancea meyersii CBS 8951]
METKTLPLYTAKQLQEHSSAKDCWVSLYNRKLYNVTKFLDEHPGGPELILEHAGKDITEVLKDATLHEHSVTAYEALDENYLVGYLATPDEESKLLNPSGAAPPVEVRLQDDYDSTVFVPEVPSEEKLSIVTDYSRDFTRHKFLDLNKPLLMQMLRADFTKEFYLDQIHRPRHYGRGSAPLFGNFLEPLSKTAWYVIPIVWFPVILYHIYTAFQHMNRPFATFLFGVGLFVWTLIEYGMHRFLFHLDEYLPNNQIAYTLHFLLHGVHHYLPMDRYRLVMPPTLFVLLCTPFYKLVFGLLPHYWACAGFAGGMFGYMCYDLTHYFLHHAKLPTYLQKLKRYHMEHHYKNYELGFGVTSWFWDNVFGTYLGENAPLSKIKFE